MNSNSMSNLASVQGALAQAKLDDKIYSGFKDAIYSMGPRNPESLKRFLKENNMSAEELANSVFAMLSVASTNAFERLKKEVYVNVEVYKEKLKK